MRTRIKICGLTNLSDVLYAASLGVDAVGFVFAESPRRVSPEVARDIISHLPSFVTTVGVFVDEDERKVKEIASRLGLNTLQFHGSESPSYCLKFKQNVIKAFRLNPIRCQKTSNGLKGSETGAEEEIEKFKAYQKVVKSLLLDASQKPTQSCLPVPASGGQTGNQQGCWEVALMAKPLGQIILAGGLNPENVASAIQKVRPYAVDISSGVEVSPGIKDHKKMAQLVKEVRKADETA